MNKEQAVHLSNLVAQLHGEWGGCVLCLDGELANSRFPDLSLLQWGPPVEIQGRELLPKQHVRAFFWDHRHTVLQIERRPTAVVWSAYDPETDTSAVGFGFLVEPSPALREKYVIAE